MSTLSVSPIELQNVGAARESWLRRQSAKWKKDVAFVLHQVRTLTLVLRHPGVPWHARLVAGCAVGYLVSPIQLIPTFIPVIGQMDDLLVLFLGMKLLRKWTPDEILAECEAKAAVPVFGHSVEHEPGVLAVTAVDGVEKSAVLPVTP